MASAPSVSRLGLITAGPNQIAVSYPIDYSMPPGGAAQILPGSTWNFQFWFRDGSTADLTDALSVQFRPPVPIPSMEIVIDLPRQGHPLGDTPGGGVIVMNTAAELQAAWDLIESSSIPPRPVPQVDMDRVTLVAVFAGFRLSSGFSIEVSDARLSVTTLSITSLETQPGLGCGVNFGATSPMQMIAIRKIDGVLLGDWTPETTLRTCP